MLQESTEEQKIFHSSNKAVHIKGIDPPRVESAQAKKDKAATDSAMVEWEADAERTLMLDASARLSKTKAPKTHKHASKKAAAPAKKAGKDEIAMLQESTEEQKIFHSSN